MYSLFTPPPRSPRAQSFTIPHRQVHLRLGDLNMVNGMYNEAAEEFGKCLAHRTALPEPVSRGVADAHVRRAQALFYASTLDGADKVRHETVVVHGCSFRFSRDGDFRIVGVFYRM